jgi:catechol 2,3-dioxygenase-like lactoylglutathione lyase family enzyme
LLNGLNHIGMLSNDIDRLYEFYRDVFDATLTEMPDMPDGMRLAFIHIGPFTELNVFQIDGNHEAERQIPIFERGRLDHIALQAASLEAFEKCRDRLIAGGWADDFVTDFGPILSMFFRDPDGLECELCVENPDAIPGVLHPPDTPAARYSTG